MSEVYIGVKFESKFYGNLEGYGEIDDKVKVLLSIIHKMPEE